MQKENRRISRRAALAGIAATAAFAIGRQWRGGPFASVQSVDASVGGLPVFPPDNPWNLDISGLPPHPNSDALIASIGLNTGLHPDFGTTYNGAPNGIPYALVSGQPPVLVVFTEYGDQSDPGPYPIPPDAPIEGGAGSSGDRHVLVVDAGNRTLYELYHASPQADGSWQAGSGAVFDLTSNAVRPEGWTSADAAGLPIFPGLVHYDEVVDQGIITHALRFTVQHTRKAYVYPARHYASASTNPNDPPMGMRVRLKAGYDISTFPPRIRVILRAMQTYGMFVADNGANWFVSGAPDPRWDDDELVTNFARVKGRDFEVIGNPPPAQPTPPAARPHARPVGGSSGAGSGTPAPLPVPRQ